MPTFFPLSRNFTATSSFASLSSIRTAVPNWPLPRPLTCTSQKAQVPVCSWILCLLHKVLLPGPLFTSNFPTLCTVQLVSALLHQQPSTVQRCRDPNPGLKTSSELCERPYRPEAAGQLWVQALHANCVYRGY